MQFIRKNLYRIVFAIVSVMLLISIVTSAVSLASYITGRTVNEDNVGVAPISCSFTVSNSQDGKFINAPFMQSIISGQTKPVQMNTVIESEINVVNSGSYGNSYQYSFVFYMPKEFAESVMFQLVRVDNSRATRSASAASEFYQIDTANGKLLKKAILADTDKIPNDYQSVIDDGKELILNGYAVEEATPRTVTREYTYTTYYHDTYTVAEDEGVAEQSEVKLLLCPIVAKEEQAVTYYRVTVTLPAGSDYVLNEEAGSIKIGHTYLFRCVPRAAMDRNVYSKVWNAAADKEAGKLPEVPEGYKCRWASGTDAVLEIAEIPTDGSAEIWRQILPTTEEDCIGLTNPTKINVVFTQVS